MPRILKWDKCRYYISLYLQVWHDKKGFESSISISISKTLIYWRTLVYWDMVLRTWLCVKCIKDLLLDILGVIYVTDRCATQVVSVIELSTVLLNCNPIFPHASLLLTAVDTPSDKNTYTQRPGCIGKIRISLFQEKISSFIQVLQPSQQRIFLAQFALSQPNIKQGSK